MSKICSYYIGSRNGSGRVFEDEESFIEAIREEISEAEREGKEHFDVTIEEAEA